MQEWEETSGRQSPPDPWRRLPGAVVPPSPGGPAPAREGGLRRVRRLSNWSVAALVVGVGATTGILARSVPPATTGAVAVAPSGTTGTPSASGGQSAPSVAGPVATTSASGVTVGASAPASAPAPGPQSSASGRMVAASSGDS